MSQPRRQQALRRLAGDEHSLRLAGMLFAWPAWVGVAAVLLGEHWTGCGLVPMRSMAVDAPSASGVRKPSPRLVMNAVHLPKIQ